jgi:ABC-2 type transport system permease protein
MNRILRALRKHAAIYLLFMKNSLMGYLEYRANLFAALTMELVFLVSKLLYAAAVYRTGLTVNGLSPDQVMLFIGTYIIMTAIYTGLFMDNFYRLPEHIRTGTLDLYITKPISLQFMATMRHVNFVLPVPNFIAGIWMVLSACDKLGIRLEPAVVAGYLLFLASSTCVTYALFLAPQILSFWTVRSGAIIEIADRCWDFNTMPMAIYGKWMQRIGVFVIPVFFITNFPAMFLTGRIRGALALWVIAAPAIFLTAVRAFWRFALKRYTSASS